MDALELLINRRSASAWLNPRQRVNNCRKHPACGYACAGIVHATVAFFCD